MKDFYQATRELSGNNSTPSNKEPKIKKNYDKLFFICLFIVAGIIGTGFSFGINEQNKINTQQTQTKQVPDGKFFLKTDVTKVGDCEVSGGNFEQRCSAEIIFSGETRKINIIGYDVKVGKTVYLECVDDNGNVNCNRNWKTFLNETYLIGGER